MDEGLIGRVDNDTFEYDRDSVPCWAFAFFSLFLFLPHGKKGRGYSWWVATCLGVPLLGRPSGFSQEFFFLLCVGSGVEIKKLL